MEIPFIKISNAGNDYVYVSEKSVARARSSLSSLARRISDRNSGVGSDGLIVVDIIDSGTAMIRIFNRDGSEAELCGNGLRGTVLYLKKTTGSRIQRFVISTRWDDYKLRLVKSDSISAVIEAELGAPSFEAANIGYLYDSANCLGITIVPLEKERVLYCVAMPNPQAVIFVDNFDFNWQEEGMRIENNPIFKNKINVMFTRVDSKNKISVMPWERGSGATGACGSGAAAATVISSLMGFTGNEVKVSMPGGDLRTRWKIDENKIYQSGPSRIVFTGLFQP